MQAWQIEECAALETLFSPPIDALLRPWESPGDLLLALADKIAGSKGEYGRAEEPVLTAPKKAAVRTSRTPRSWTAASSAGATWRRAG